MKKLFLFVGILLSFNLHAQSALVKVTTPIFEVYYSEEYEQPVYLEYTVDCWDGTYSRKGMNFYRVKDIHTSDDADYYKNVWDKGHLAPAASFSCDLEELKQTFSYLNCALQHEDLNRGPWKYLEEEERILASIFGKVDVEIKVHFENSFRLPTGAMVPSGFTKTISLINEDSELIKMVYYFPNNGHVQLRDNYQDFQTQ